MGKSIYKSKTFWLAITQAIIGACLTIDTDVPWLGVLLIIKSIIDVVIRFTTDQPIVE